MEYPASRALLILLEKKGGSKGLCSQGISGGLTVSNELSNGEQTIISFI